MTDTPENKLNESPGKLTPTLRFGVIAVRRGFVTRADLDQAMRLQLEDDLDGREHRLIGRILFELQLLTVLQIEQILNELLEKST